MSRAKGTGKCVASCTPQRTRLPKCRLHRLRRLICFKIFIMASLWFCMVLLEVSTIPSVAKDIMPGCSSLATRSHPALSSVAVLHAYCGMLRCATICDVPCAVQSCLCLVLWRALLRNSVGVMLYPITSMSRLFKSLSLIPDKISCANSY